MPISHILHQVVPDEIEEVDTEVERQVVHDKKGDSRLDCSWELLSQVQHYNQSREHHEGGQCQLADYRKCDDHFKHGKEPVLVNSCETSTCKAFFEARPEAEDP